VQQSEDWGHEMVMIMVVVRFVVRVYLLKVRKGRHKTVLSDQAVLTHTSCTHVVHTRESEK
jgi:hypothetical protein